jgi:hypothetical protein
MSICHAFLSIWLLSTKSKRKVVENIETITGVSIKPNVWIKTMSEAFLEHSNGPSASVHRTSVTKWDNSSFSKRNCLMQVVCWTLHRTSILIRSGTKAVGESSASVLDRGTTRLESHADHPYPNWWSLRKLSGFNVVKWRSFGIRHRVAFAPTNSVTLPRDCCTPKPTCLRKFLRLWNVVTDISYSCLCTWFGWVRGRREVIANNSPLTFLNENSTVFTKGRIRFFNFLSFRRNIFSDIRNLSHSISREIGVLCHRREGGYIKDLF